MLGKREPQALALVAFYAVLLKEGEWAWWVGGWSVRSLKLVYESLDAESRLWIWWPMEQLGWSPAAERQVSGSNRSGDWQASMLDAHAMLLGSHWDKDGLADKIFGGGMMSSEEQS